MGGDGVTFIDLEFDTGTTGGALLGDIATSLVSIDELLRDLGSIAAYPSSVEFRNIEIVAIEMRSPLKIRLSLFGISPEALTAFQEICRNIILDREGRLPVDVEARVNEQEARRLHGHVTMLQNASIPLKRIEVTEE
ncbi:MAG TPA: hypothetical protein VM096_12015 [Vicinamibacterales bacterium]|nr:hypothetical protein [Vicinamibacterales bacterium]